jgi:hypothetical protein
VPIRARTGGKQGEIEGGRSALFDQFAEWRGGVWSEEPIDYTLPFRDEDVPNYLG